MIKVLKFTFFNVILGLTDVLTDLTTFLFLLEENHILWALLTAQWMVTPFLVHAFEFLLRWIPFLYNPHASTGSARQNGRQDQQGTTPSELWPSASTRKLPPICPSSWPSKTFGGQKSSTASTTAYQAFGLGTQKRCKRFCTRQEKARMQNPCTKLVHRRSHK